MDYNREVLYVLNNKVAPLFVKVVTNYINIERISIDSTELIDTKTNMHRLWLIYTYLYDYSVDSSEESLPKLMKVINNINNINRLLSGSADTLYSTLASSLDGSMTEASSLYAGVGLDGNSYNTYTDETWSLDDLLASPTDTIVTQSDI